MEDEPLHYTLKRTNLTDKDIDEKEASTPAGAVLNPVNKEYTTRDDKSSASRTLSGTGSEEDEKKTREAAKKIEKNSAAEHRDRREKADTD